MQPSRKLGAFRVIFRVDGKVLLTDIEVNNNALGFVRKTAQFHNPLQPHDRKERTMKFFSPLLLALALIVGGITTPAFAEDRAPLFINLTTDDPHRADMGISFGKNQLERGHPLTIFLNDKGVLIGSQENAAPFAEHQKVLGELVDQGATVLICPMCMKHYGVKEADLLPGLQVGNPELTGGALFKDNTRTLTW